MRNSTLIPTNKAKPFIKWAGGKSQLISQFEALLPPDFDRWEDVTYIEPFVGGGAMLFHLLQTYPCIRHAVINDINPHLTTCYLTVRDYPTDLLLALRDVQDEYYACSSQDARRDMYLRMRSRFNSDTLDAIERAMLFIFLNRTCFNGLYRVNRSGKFNVPCGRYDRPLICDPDTIYADSDLLQRVEILTGDFEQTISRVNGQTFCYLDPPYRPISDTSAFTDYAREVFDDDSQRRLKRFCDRLDRMGVAFMLSNSDSLNNDAQDRFFDDLYRGYRIDRVWASRNINANPKRRGKLTEILVSNYHSSNISKEQILSF